VKAEEMGIPTKIADEHFGRYGDKAFLGALNKLASRLTQSAAPVGNKLAYLKTILENGAAEESVEQPTASVEAVQEEREPPALSSIQTKQIQMEEQRAIQLETVKSEIAALPKDEMRALVDELKAYMATQMFPARIRLRVEAGEFDNPMLQGILARIYWKKTRGTGWSAEPC
jgi:hypothetical protein